MSKQNKIIIVIAILMVAMIWYFTESGVIGKKKEILGYSFGSLNFGSQAGIVNDGCTDEAAENYNDTATFDNGTCFYVLGCCDTQASNYDPMADSCNLSENNLLNCNYS